jgi:HEPN domain-containing protein
MKKATAAWVRKAEADWAAAQKLARGKPPLHDQVCFLCQQSMEKYFKTLLQESGLSVPRTHDLEDLLGLLLPSDSSLGVLRRGLDALTEYAVDYRYPGMHANARKALAARRLAGRGREELRYRLGLRPKRAK